MKELDLVLTRWLDQGFEQASSEQRAAFAEFLDLPDPEIAGYLLGNGQPASAKFRQLVNVIREC